MDRVGLDLRLRPQTLAPHQSDPRYYLDNQVGRLKYFTGPATKPVFHTGTVVLLPDPGWIGCPALRRFQLGRWTGPRHVGLRWRVRVDVPPRG